MLSVVGLGPGSKELMTVRAVETIEQAEVVVGYTGYIDLISKAMLEGKEVLSTGMRGEVERCKLAVERAAAGKNVVVVCSGDPGIYAMAGLVMEILEKRDDAKDIEFEIVPGVPAFCAAAALLGAPLMHDFASISLSDLLTPWEVIEKRLAAAADADFVIAIYNPKSRKRSGHLRKALDIVSRFKKDDTFVGIVNKADREGQNVIISKLGEVDEDKIDMQTVLLIGNNSTRKWNDKMITPRGYAAKYDLDD
ncbi:precorrin-3B C(17)-methyltransferase [Maridesulfovibrio bastinii]|uniref:precorrin-3B C(17)-methyltransferase n=1 Tax=Maridesulfovibrio bastinii TaxID=47157 RepID=UPI000427EBB1|nr:precorrin-3B C(17)-methyltransferase [Maridesulfovibrio bastinii]